jgi:hypothetical protein
VAVSWSGKEIDIMYLASSIFKEQKIRENVIKL